MITKKILTEISKLQGIIIFNQNLEIEDLQKKCRLLHKKLGMLVLPIGEFHQLRLRQPLLCAESVRLLAQNMYEG